MNSLPVVSGRKVVKALGKIGYVFDRQRGSHMILRQPDDRFLIFTPKALWLIAQGCGSYPGKAKNATTPCTPTGFYRWRATHDDRTPLGYGCFPLFRPPRVAAATLGYVTEPLRVKTLDDLMCN